MTSGALHYGNIAIRSALRLLTDTAPYQKKLLKAIIKDDAAAIRNCYYHGADLNSTSWHLYKLTPLQLAVDCKADRAIQVLIELGVDCNKRSDSRDKITALFLACRAKKWGEPSDNQIKRIKVLLDAGANPNMAVIGGVTPLIEVCCQSNVKAMEILRAYGADPHLIDARKNSARDVSNQGVCDLDREEPFEEAQKLHPKINKRHLFKSGFLLPHQAIQALNSYTGTVKKLKKYSLEIPSLFRSVVIGTSNYILYDSHQFFTTCPGCLNGISPHNPLGKGGEAKVKIAQDSKTKQFYAARIATHIGQYEIEILQLLNCFVDHIKVGKKHYIIQRLHNSIRLSDFTPSDDAVVFSILKSLFWQINILHKNGYIHRDIASDNVLIDPETLEVNLIDFGCSIKKPSVWNGFVYGTIRKIYSPLAPELERASLTGYPYSEQSDLFAVGEIVHLFLLKCSLPTRNTLHQMLSTLTARDPKERKNAQYYIDFLESLPQ